MWNPKREHRHCNYIGFYLSKNYIKHLNNNVIKLFVYNNCSVLFFLCVQIKGDFY